MPRDGYPTTIVSPDMLQKLSIVPRLAAAHGKGFTLIDGSEIKYFAIADLTELPSRFDVAMSYDPRQEVLLINDRNLSKCSWMLVKLEQQSRWVWENSITERSRKTIKV
ncbi:hypothetical protein [Leptolyngbya sp. GGD]|uniref:hypothetical protein n=1 Tax=Leptolyngbya sp. GGD TaxID=2997907 RepID=UPI00227A532D|nr:hypothetical protein [Leptolyngbya sp. GGD]MCY6492135.1 hypothetical protein [Leptolyngbya sp. GGD]